MTDTPKDIARLMKRCQIGVGGRNAIDDAHDIMAECYGTLGKLSMDLAAVTRERDLFHAALDHLARLGNEPCLGNSIGNQIAQDALGGKYIAEVEQEQKKRNAEIDALRAEVERLRKAESDFHMAYRMKCDEETKTLHVEIERLTSAIRWACGYDEGPPEFEPPEDADRRSYWWRNELMRRAALQEPTP